MLHVRHRLRIPSFTDTAETAASETNMQAINNKEAQQTGWCNWPSRQAGATGPADRLVQQAQQTGWCNRPSRQAGATGIADRLVQQAEDVTVLLVKSFIFVSVGLLTT